MGHWIQTASWRRTMAIDPVRAKSLFLAASELGEAERAAYLDRECGADAALRGRVEALLRADAPAVDATSAHEPGLPLSTKAHAAEPESGVIIGGKYKLSQRIGEGGMGSVWLA